MILTILYKFLKKFLKFGSHEIIMSLFEIQVISVNSWGLGGVNISKLNKSTDLEKNWPIFWKTLQFGECRFWQQELCLWSFLWWCVGLFCRILHRHSVQPLLLLNRYQPEVWNVCQILTPARLNASWGKPGICPHRGGGTEPWAQSKEIGTCVHTHPTEHRVLQHSCHSPLSRSSCRLWTNLCYSRAAHDFGWFWRYPGWGSPRWWPVHRCTQLRRVYPICWKHSSSQMPDNPTIRRALPGTCDRKTPTTQYS